MPDEREGAQESRRLGWKALVLIVAFHAAALAIATHAADQSPAGPWTSARRSDGAPSGPQRTQVPAGPGLGRAGASLYDLGGVTC
jgi:hypothetical protein